MKHKTAAIIVAAGSGTRMGSVAKPMIKLGEKTVLGHVLEAFEKSGLVDEIIVVCKAPGEYSKLSEGITKNIKFTYGGNTRTRSVNNGVAECSQDVGYICIHDCARPFIKHEDIDRVIGRAFENGAACACSPVKNTIKYIDTEENLIYTPKRENLFNVQTPQVFKKEVYIAAYAKAAADGLNTTDETSIIENAGFSVDYVDIGEYNFKLTDAHDINIARALLFLEKRTDKKITSAEE